MYKYLLIIVSCFLLGSLFAQEYSSETIIPNKIIVKVNNSYRKICKDYNIENKRFTNLVDRYGLSDINKKFPYSNRPEKEYDNNGNKLVDISLIYELRCPGKANLNKLISDLYKTGIFEYVQPCFKNKLMYVPNDPFNKSNQYYLTNIKAYEAWDSCKGDTSIVIGIVDTGVDIDHEDLIDNIAYNYSDPINGIDDDNDGFIDNFRGWDLGEGDNNPQSNVNHHGAHVAGTAAATTDNGKGISGTGFLSKFLPVKISDENGDLIQSYEGIVYAADHGCTIINCSWGGDRWHPFGQDIINYATFNKNALVVAAAGNSDNEEFVYPASYDNVISVAATNINDIKWSGSTYNYRVNLSAPGENIFFTKNDNLYGSGWGTSYASPIVAASAAILKKKFPDFTALQLGAQLINTTDNIDTIFSNSEYANKLGTGRLNMYRALIDSIIPYTRFYNISFSGNDTVYFEGNLINYLSPTMNLDVTINSLTPEIEMINDFYDFGIINTNENVSLKEGNFYFSLNGLQYDKKAVFEFVFIDGVYKAEQYFETIVNPSYLNVDYNNIKTTLTANGRLGYNSYPQKNGNGFIFNGVENFLFEGGLIIATSPGKVLDNIYDDQDFKVEQKVTEKIEPDNNYKMFSASFNDSSIINDKIGVSIYQNNYLWQSINDEDFIIFEYNFVNNNAYKVSNFFAGIYADWDIVGSNHDKAAFESELNMIYTWNIENPVYYVGIQVLNTTKVIPYAIDNVEGGNGGIDIQDGFTDNEKYLAMTSEKLTAGNAEFGSDVATLISSGPYEINENDTLKLAFAISAASNLYNLKKSAIKALKKYKEFVLYERELNSNERSLKIWPNPTNQYLYIDYPSSIKLNKIEIYDLLGKKIKTVPVHKTYSLYLDVKDLKEGVYLIIGKTDKQIIQKKIMVIH